MDTEVKNAIKATLKETQYDDKAKRLLGQKIVLAHILIKTVHEFRQMSPKKVVSYIEGEPFISVIPIETGLTNIVKEKEGSRVIGFNSENAEINEGTVRFDIVFYVRIPSQDNMKDEISQIIINVEAQKKEPGEYKILNRAIFYVCRLVSSQKERDFVNSNYDNIKRVFSIWICMNMNENSMDYIHLTNEKLLGDYEWKGKFDLLNIVLLGLSNELPEHEEQYELHRLLGTLLSKELSEDEKLMIIEKEYNIPVEGCIGEDVRVMCNLSQGIKEDGIAIGEANFIVSMHNKGYTLEQIAEVANKSLEEVAAIIEGKKKVLV